MKAEEVLQAVFRMVREGGHYGARVVWRGCILIFKVLPALAFVAASIETIDARALALHRAVGMGRRQNLSVAAS